jgi:hypothetical protein
VERRTGKIMKKPSLKTLRVCQVLVGTMDTLTGVLLVAAPDFTLRLMGIRDVPESLTMVSWVGVFVLAVGASYFLINWRSESETDLAGWRMQWKITGVARLVVGTFVAWHILAGGLESTWQSVALTDFVVAGAQFLGLAQGWLGGRGAR